MITPAEASIEITYGTEWYSLWSISKNIPSSQNRKQFLRYHKKSKYQFIMSKNQIGEQVQVFCKLNCKPSSIFISIVSGKNWTENVKIQWEYKTPTLKMQPNVTRLQISSIDSNYFNFDLYYRIFQNFDLRISILASFLRFHNFEQNKANVYCS